MAMEPLESLRHGKTCANLSQRSRWKVSGADAARYLNGQLTQKVDDLQDGHARHSAICNAKGKLEGDLHIARSDNFFLLDWPAELGNSLQQRLEKYIIADEVEMEPCPLKLSFLAGESLPEVHLGTIAIRSRRHGLDGFDLWMPEGAIAPVLMADPETWDQQRILSQTPLATVDYNSDHLGAEIFQEETTLHYHKGCYVGQEVLNRIRTIGKVNKKLVSLTTHSAPGTGLPLTLSTEEKEVGKVTSMTKTPGEKGSWTGMAILPTSLGDEALKDSAGNTWHLAVKT